MESASAIQVGKGRTAAYATTNAKYPIVMVMASAPMVSAFVFADSKESSAKKVRYLPVVLKSSKLIAGYSF